MSIRLKLILSLAMITAFVALSVSLPGLAGAGDLEPSADPDNDGSAMHTLEDLYNYVDTGAVGTKRTGGFAEPASDPGSTGRTLDEVYDKITENCLTCDGIFKCITCEGTSHGTRWCDNGDGTVTDLTTELVWLQNASWGGTYAFWINTATGTNAHDRAAQVEDGNPVTDGSVEGDWRLPTKEELYGLVNGTEVVGSGSPRAFTSVQSGLYWTSTTNGASPDSAWYLSLSNGSGSFSDKTSSLYIWPVRGGN